MAGGCWKQNSRPPRPAPSSVPSWERTFCASVCRVPWGKICEAKRLMPIYKNITDWDDSGALETFNNAKARYWAEINGLPCELPLPDPEMFIDEIDPNPCIDPELIADLEKPPPPPPASNNNKYLSYEAFVNATLPVVAQGWGDAEEERPVPAGGGGSGEASNENVGCMNSWNEHGTTWASRGRRCDQWKSKQGRADNRNRNGYGSTFTRLPTVTMQWRPKASRASNG